MNTCTNPKIGRLLTHFELDTLGAEERETFEQHLMDCRYCFQELQRGRLVSAAMLDRRAEILAAIATEKRVIPPLPARSIRQFYSNARSRFQRFATSLRRPLVWGPAAAAIAIVNLFVLFNRTPQIALRYQPLLTFEKLPYEAITFRDWPNQSADVIFEQGMKYYHANRYDSAAVVIEQAVSLQPEVGAWWLYLGVCYYLQHKPGMAIAALQRADSLNSMIFSIRTRWYLAQSYLLSNDTTHAMPLLEWVAKQDLSYAREAADLLQSVREK